MKIKTLIVTLLFAVSMWAQTAAPVAPADSAKAGCCKEGAACCKDGADCCGKNAKADCCKDGAECCKKGTDCCAKMAKVDGKDAKGCCGGSMCKRHKAEKAS